MTVKVTSPVVVSSTAMLVRVTEMPVLHALANDTPGSVTDSTLSHVSLSRVAESSVPSPPTTETLTVESPLHGMTTWSPAPAGTESCCMAPSWSMTKVASSLPAATSTVALSQSPVTVPLGATNTGGGFWSPGPTQANQWLMVGTFFGGLPTSGAGRPPPGRGGEKPAAETVLPSPPPPTSG